MIYRLAKFIIVMRLELQQPVKVIAKKGKKSVSSATSGQRGMTTTVLCACNAAGYYIHQ